MFKYLCPDLYMTNILDINPALLKSMGVRGIICDLDNTIIPWDEDILQTEIVDWFATLKAADFKLCLLSNSLHNRVNGIAQILEIDAIPAAIKPRKGAFRKAVDRLGVDPREIVVIGDQLFTDIFGGKRLALKTILVHPIAEKELFWTLFVRRFERLVLTGLRRRGLLNDQD